MTTIGELVIDRTRIAQIGRLLQAKYKEDELVQSLGETSAHVAKVVDDLQNEIMQVRLMPIGTVFNGFPRMVRDLAQRFGKEAEFLVDGQDTEIDRTVIERIRPPGLTPPPESGRAGPHGRPEPARIGPRRAPPPVPGRGRNGPDFRQNLGR